MNKNNQILNIFNWEIVPPEKLLIKLNEREAKKRYTWGNDGSISPLDLYSYLKARFGNPNGASMLFRHPSTDNVIQWHYTLSNEIDVIEFFGFNRQLEIVVHTNDDIDLVDFKNLINNIISDFSNYGKQISNIKRQFEKWFLFINPFRRLDEVAAKLEKRIKTLNINNPIPIISPLPSESDARIYKEKFEEWQRNMAEARLLGTSLKLILPIYGESFVNLIIFILAKKEIKSDERLYEDLIRKQIDIRIKSMHLYCNGFTKKITDNDKPFKLFRTLMNRRNDFLHGNVDPLKLKFDEVLFDDTIPLFRDEKSLSVRLIEKSICYIEPKSVLDDFETIRDFISFVFDCLSPDIKFKVLAVMDDPHPGWEINDKRVGVLFNPIPPEFTFAQTNKER